MQETRVQSLGQEDPLEKEMATHSNIFAWEIPWTEETGGLQSVHGVIEESDATLRLNNYRSMLYSFFFSCQHQAEGLTLSSQ